MKRKTIFLLCLLLVIVLSLSIALSGCSLTPNKAKSNATPAPKTPSTVKEMLRDLETRVGLLQSNQQDQQIANRNILESLAIIEKQLTDIQKQLDSK